MRSGHVLFTFLSLFIFGLIDNVRGPIYPKVIEVFGLSASASSWIFTLASLVSFIVTLAIPLWLPRFGAVNPTKAAMLFHASALLCMGVSGIQGEMFWAFLAGSAFLGLAMGIQSATVNLIIAKVSTPANGAKLFSGLHSMYGLASLLAPLLMGGVFRLQLPWAWFLLALALVPLAHFFYYRRLPSLELAQAAGEQAPAPTPWGPSIRLGVVFSFYVATEIMVSSRLVAFLSASGLELDIASYGLTGFFILLLAGRALFSFYTPKLSPLALLSASAAMTAAFFLLSLLVHPLFLVGTGGSISYFFPYGMSYIRGRYPNAQGLIARIMIFVGAMLAIMHFAFGLVADAFGISNAMWMGAALVSVVLGLLLFEARISSKTT